ncbi:hypothetical protein SRHO_G00015350 [Serrasalmus rhombeus]
MTSLFDAAQRFFSDSQQSSAPRSAPGGRARANRDSCVRGCVWCSSAARPGLELRSYRQSVSDISSTISALEPSAGLPLTAVPSERLSNQGGEAGIAPHSWRNAWSRVRDPPGRKRRHSVTLTSVSHGWRAQRKTERVEVRWKEMLKEENSGSLAEAEAADEDDSRGIMETAGVRMVALRVAWIDGDKHAGNLLLILAESRSAWPGVGKPHHHPTTPPPHLPTSRY